MVPVCEGRNDHCQRYISDVRIWRNNATYVELTLSKTTVSTYAAVKRAPGSEQITSESCRKCREHERATAESASGKSDGIPAIKILEHWIMRRKGGTAVAVGDDAIPPRGKKSDIDDKTANKDRLKMSRMESFSD